MAVQTVFRRMELKYLLSREQKNRVLEAIFPYMQPDRYGKTQIRNLYFDTDTYLLARRSLEKPFYKEKLRLRSYGKAEPGGKVFAELKKKYDSVVYKRRVSLSYEKAVEWLENGGACPENSQIAREIDDTLHRYASLRPRVFLSYEREAFAGKEDSLFRVTFDERVLARTQQLNLSLDPGGRALLPEGKVLMELKCVGGMPLWMAQLLSRERIYKNSFSKYGTAYQELIFSKIYGKGKRVEEYATVFQRDI